VTGKNNFRSFLSNFFYRLFDDGVQAWVCVDCYSEKIILKFRIKIRYGTIVVSPRCSVVHAQVRQSLVNMCWISCRVVEAWMWINAGVYFIFPPRRIPMQEQALYCQSCTLQQLRRLPWQQRRDELHQAVLPERTFQVSAQSKFYFVTAA